MQKQQAFAQKVQNELDKVTMSWTNELRAMYPTYLKALRLSSCAKLGVNAEKYRELLKTDNHGINMNIAAVLINNLEAVSPQELGIDCEEYAALMEANKAIGEYWESLVVPIRASVQKRMEIMDGKSGMKPIIGQA